MISWGVTSQYIKDTTGLQCTAMIRGLYLKALGRFSQSARSTKLAGSTPSKNAPGELMIASENNALHDVQASFLGTYELNL